MTAKKKDAVATEAPPETNGKKLKQQVLPGTEPVHDPKLTRKVEAYHEAKMARVNATKLETETRDDLLDAMVEWGEDYYETPDGIVAKLSKTEKVKTSKKGDDDDDE